MSSRKPTLPEDIIQINDLSNEDIKIAEETVETLTAKLACLNTKLAEAGFYSAVISVGYPQSFGDMMHKLNEDIVLCSSEVSRLNGLLASVTEKLNNMKAKNAQK